MSSSGPVKLSFAQMAARRLPQDGLQSGLIGASASAQNQCVTSTATRALSQPQQQQQQSQESTTSTTTTSSTSAAAASIQQQTPQLSRSLSSLSLGGQQNSASTSPTASPSSATPTSTPRSRWSRVSYVVNIPVYCPEKGKEGAIEQIEKALATLEKLASSHREFHVIVGLNHKGEKGGNGKCSQSLTEAVECLQKYFGKRCMVVGYTWTPLSPAAAKNNSKGINFVDLRNRLFYHETTQGTLAECTQRCMQSSGRAEMVKCLFLDPDTEVTPDQLTKLERHWATPQAALVTSGFYSFPLTAKQMQLKSSTNMLSRERWEGFIEGIDHAVDLSAKQKLAQQTFSVDFSYKPLKNWKINDENDLRAAVKGALLILNAFKPGNNDVLNRKVKPLKTLYEQLKNALEGPKGTGLSAVDKNATINRLIDNIQGAEGKLTKEDKNRLYTTYTIKGDEHILYPCEAALFVTMAERDPNRNACSFEALAKSAQSLWGDREGQSEGENLACAMGVHCTGSGQSLVDFPWTFETAIPPRMLEIPTYFLNKLPKTKEGLKLIVHDRPNDILGTIEQIFCEKPQSVLHESWANSRYRSMGRTCSRVPAFAKGAVLNQFAEKRRALELFRAEQMERALGMVKVELSETCGFSASPHHDLQAHPTQCKLEHKEHKKEHKQEKSTTVS